MLLSLLLRDLGRGRTNYSPKPMIPYEIAYVGQVHCQGIVLVLSAI